ncbi:hypothetical protein [Streptomyces sp. NPDC090025]|uniref:hypothetical protein n=1 Tax=Streptomyces sp. NPDC090025 TaxID=3365922 RepID=UPI003835E589
MPTYQEIMQTDLGKLNTAAEGWKSMAEKFKKVEEQYGKEVQSVATGGPLWTGQAQQFGNMSFGITRKELASAQKEALAMESLLRDAYGTLTELKGRVKSAVDEAVTAGMKVNESGSASFDYSKVDAQSANSIRHDPDLRETELSYTRKISDAVKAVSDFDADVKVALLNASGADGTAALGFNSKPVGDVEAVEALALSDKVRDGKASKEELAHYRDLLAQNSKDKHFSEAYLDGLGAKDALKIADRMNLAANERGLSDADKKLYQSINTGLADTIAAGTSDPKSYAYRPFVDGLKELGGQNLASNTQPTLGYQMLATLMNAGDPKAYGKEFLNEIGDHMIAIEKDKPQVWLHFFDGTRPNIVNDPLDAVLNIMSKDPGDAEYFLDPKAPGNTNEHLKFLLSDRKWPDPLMNTLYSAPMEMADPTKAQGLGNAIQAAATGHAPGEPLGAVGAHTEGQARVMQSAIQILDDDKGGDEFDDNLANIRQPMARALADYVADTHITLNGQESDYGEVDGKDDITTLAGPGENSHIAVGQGSLIRVMRGIADDGPSYALLYEAERAYSAHQLGEAPPFSGDPKHSSSAEWDHRSRNIGMAMGALNEIGADVYMDKEDDRVKWAEGTSEHTAAAVNGMIGEIPVVGTVGGSIIDSVKYEWVKDVTDLAEEERKKEISNNFASGKQGMTKIFNEWQRQEHLDTGPFNSARDSAYEGHDAGINEAKKHLG